LEEVSETLKSSAKRRLVRGKVTRLIRSFIAIRKREDTPNLLLRDAILDKLMSRIGILNSYCYGPVVKEGLK